MSIEPTAKPFVIILHIDHEGRIIHSNQDWEQITGFSVNDSCGKPFNTFLSDQSKHILSGIPITEFLTAGWPEDQPCQIITKDGRVYNLRLSTSRVHQNGRVESGVVVLVPFAETTASQQSETDSDLHQKELLMRSLSNFSDVIPWHFDFKSMQFTSVGHQSMEVFGYPPESFSTLESWAERIHPEEREWSVNYCMAESKAGRNHTLEYRMRTADENYLWIRDVVTVVTEGGEPVELLGMFLNITNLKDLQEKLMFQIEVGNALQDLSHTLLSSSLTFSDVAKLTLNYARQVTGSEHGYVSTIDPITKEMISHTLTEMFGDACKITGENQRIAFPINPDGTYNGMYGYSLNTKTSFFTNDPPSHPGYEDSAPAGHIPIENFLSVPALVGDKLVGQIALANTADEYTHAHLEAVQQFADMYALAIERARMERVEKESQAIYRSLIENTNVIPFSVDLAANNFTYVGPQLAAITGFPSNKLQTFEDWAAIIHPEDREFAVNYCNVETQKGKDHVFEYRMLTADNEVVWIRDVVAVIRENNKPVSLVGFFFDITNLKETERKLADFNQELEARVKQRTRELQEANWELESFTYSVAHDLRAPLRAMRGFSEILLEENADQLDKTALSYLRRIYDGGKQMNELINDLLGLSHLGRRQMDLQQVNLSEIANQTFALLVENQDHLDVQFSADLGSDILADRTLVQLLFTNLIDNAIKYSRSDEKIIIEMGIEKIESDTTYFIRDNGIGFEMEYAEKIFAPFQRLHNAEEYSGSGIGLAIVKRIVRLHNGRVWAISQRGEGTTIYFTLNAQQLKLFSSEGEDLYGFA